MSYEIIKLEQRSQEWFDFRKKHIGASEAPIIMKESPWKTPRQLMLEKWDMIDKPSYTSRSMQRGIDLEDIARETYMKMTEKEVSPLVVKSLDYPFMVASYDGISKDMKTIVEIKCPGEEDHEMAKNQKVPRKYFHQLIQQMVVAGVDSVDYFSYRDINDVALVTVHLDEVEMKKLIREEKRFWECWQNLEEPDLMPQDFAERNDVEWMIAASEYLLAKKSLKEMEQLEEASRRHLIELSGGINCEGGGIRLHKQVRKGLVDYNSIPELKIVNLDKYRKPCIQSWRLTEV